MTNPTTSGPLAAILGVVTVGLAGVLAIVALNNATDPQVVLPVSIALTAGLIGLGIAVRRP